MESVNLNLEIDNQFASSCLIVLLMILILWQ